MRKFKALFHIVFYTKNRQMTLTSDHKEDTYRFIWRIITNLNCKLLRIGGIRNHVHMLVNLNPSVALSTLLREVKANSSAWMKGNDKFPDFVGWADGYYACSLSPEHQDSVIEYIKNQENHHRGISFDDEIKNLCVNADIDFYNDDLQ